MSTSEPVAADQPLRLSFTEQMKGYVAFGISDYEQGFREGRSKESSLSVQVTILVDDVDRFVIEPNHEARAEGHVDCDGLGGRRPIESGRFNLFVDTTVEGRKQMRYHLLSSDALGHPVTLHGFKIIEDQPGIDIWRDTTELFVRIVAGHQDQDGNEDAGSPPIASGIIAIHLIDFLQQLTTFRVGGQTLAARKRALDRFGRFWLGTVWDVYADGIPLT